MDLMKILTFPAKAYTWLNGKKTYCVGWSMVFIALGGCLGSLANTQSSWDLMKLLSNGASDPNIRMLLEGMAILTGRQAIGKVSATMAKLAKMGKLGKRS
jgi:hypothetical protein